MAVCARGSWRLPQILAGPATAIALLLAGCGDGNGAATTTTETSTSSSTSAPAATATTSAATTTTEPAATVSVYFSTGDGSDCAEVESFPRSIPDRADPVVAAFDQLVAGPTDREVAAGAGSFFTAATSGAVTSITVSDALLVVDFVDLRPLLPNASTSCGSQALLAQLNATALQFDEIDRVRYEMEGSCDAFGNWLQRDCFQVDRSGQSLDVPTNERASGSGCTPPAGVDLPDGRWYGIIEEASPGQLSFDLACWFSGTAAVAAAAEDGAESPPPNDYHIRNESDRVRDVVVDPNTEVEWLVNPGDPATAETIAYEAWIGEQTGRSYRPGVWLTITGGQIVSIDEQYVP